MILSGGMNRQNICQFFFFKKKKSYDNFTVNDTVDTN